MKAKSDKELSKCVIAALLCAAVSTACARQQEENSNDDAMEMYSRMLTLTREYTDSMKVAPDSVRALDLDQRLQEALAAITMQYPSETDMRFPEGATDTLFAATERFAEMRRAAMLRVDSTAPVLPDTVAPAPPVPAQKESVR